MNKIIALAVAGLLLSSAATPSFAIDNKTKAWNDCQDQIVRVLGVGKTLAKNFYIHGSDNRFEVTGVDQNGGNVSCLWKDGHLKWASIH
ncbi:MAG: hypothetical protein ABI697_04885 [Devosia sp.]